MNKKIILIVIGIVIVIAIAVGASKGDEGYSVPVTPASDNTTQTVSDQSASSSVAAPAGATTYTLADVAKHDGQASCWTAVNGSVYDVTAWISKHPGGSDAILYLCGKDGSSAFNDQHGGQSRPESELASFKIGALAQ